MEIIKMTSIHKTYNEGKASEVHALRGLDFTVEAGESVAVMGVSGSGKSTLLHIIGCLDNFGEGTYLLNSTDVSQMQAKQLARVRNSEVGFVLQEYGLLFNESVFENVKLPLMFSEKTPFKQIRDRVFKVLGKLNIADLAKKKTRELSGGQKQRVAIARAIVNDPSIILCDEPTGALDSETAEEIMKILLKLNEEGKTLIVVTHDQKVADMMSRVVNIVDGKISNKE